MKNHTHESIILIIEKNRVSFGIDILTRMNPLTHYNGLTGRKIRRKKFIQNELVSFGR